MNCNTPPISSRTPLYFDISCLRRLHQPAFLPGTHYRQGFVLYSTTLLTAFHRSTSSVATERCLPCHSMLRDGRHLQSCCSTLVSTVYTQQHSSLVSTATSLPGQPPSLCHAYSLAAPVWPSSLWWHEIVAHAVSLPSSAAPARLPQTWLTPQVALPSTAPSVRDPTQNEANQTISSQREPFQAFRLSRM